MDRERLYVAEALRTGDKCLRKLLRLRKTRPAAKVMIRTATKELNAVMNQWETAYEKESFYRGIRILLEVQRDGSSQL